MSEGTGGGQPGSEQTASVDVDHNGAEMPPNETATVEMKQKQADGGKEVREREELAAETTCNGVEEHVNGVDQPVNGVDDEHSEVLEVDADKNEDSIEDLANVSVPELIDKFENITGDPQGDSDEETSGEYNLNVDEPQEIPISVDSAKLGQQGAKAEEIADNTETVTIDDNKVDVENANVDKTIEETHEDVDEESEEKDASVEEVVMKEETVQDAAAGDEEESGAKEEVVEEKITTEKEEVEEDTITATQEEGEEDETIGEELVTTDESSSNQKETVIDKPGEELEQVEVAVPVDDDQLQDSSNGKELDQVADVEGTVTSPKETFLRQDTYTVSTSSSRNVVTRSQTSTSLLRQDTYVVEQEEEEEETAKEGSEQNVEELTDSPPPEVIEEVVQVKGEVAMEYSDEPIYREADGDDDEEEEVEKVKIAATEDKYVTAEEVRIQKHSLEKKMSSNTSVTTTTTTSEETVSKTEQLLTKNIAELSAEKTIAVEETLPIASLTIASSLKPGQDDEEVPIETEEAALDEREEVEGLEEALLTNASAGDMTITDDDMRRRSDVDQLVEDIRDPELDSSLESIAAMVEESKLGAPVEDKLRVSPEFATAAELIDKNLDKGFDPEDPAVKGIEDWECSNNLDAMDPSLDNLRVRSRKLKNSMFKRLSKSEERKSLLEAAPTVEEEKKMVSDDEEQKGCGCFTSWLVYVFIKIFD